MDATSALDSIIEVAIGLAGFSGIIAAVGQRNPGGWGAADQLRLEILLTASGAALVFAFLPFVLAGFMNDPLVWRCSSAVVALWTGGISIFRLRQASSVGIDNAFGLRSWRLGLQATIVLMLIGNVLWWASASLYVLGVLWGLYVAFMTFVRLLLAAWRKSLDDPSPAP
jgi:hypothetical protein